MKRAWHNFREEEKSVSDKAGNIGLPYQEEAYQLLGSKHWGKLLPFCRDFGLPMSLQLASRGNRMTGVGLIQQGWLFWCSSEKLHSLTWLFLVPTRIVCFFRPFSSCKDCSVVKRFRMNIWIIYCPTNQFLEAGTCAMYGNCTTEMSLYLYMYLHGLSSS